MNGLRGVAIAVVCGAALAVTGCGSSTHTSTATTTAPPSTSTTQPAPPANHYTSQTTQSGRSVGAGTIVLRRLGTIRYSCAGDDALNAVLDPRGVLATETAYVEGAGHQHLRAGTIQPGSRFVVNAPAGSLELWHVIQSTEPETLDARITITVGTGCAGRWVANVGVISHAGAWSPPRPWL